MHLCVCFCAKVIVALVPMATLSSRRRQHLQLYPALLGYLTSRLPVGVWKTLGCCHHCPAQRVVYHGRPALDHKVSLDIFVGINASPEHDHKVLDDVSVCIITSPTHDHKVSDDISVNIIATAKH